MRRAVFVELLRSTEGATVRDLRRFLRSRGIEATPAEVTGALRVLERAGLTMKSMAAAPKWWPSPAAHVAAEILCPAVFDDELAGSN